MISLIAWAWLFDKLTIYVLCWIMISISYAFDTGLGETESVGKVGTDKE